VFSGTIIIIIIIMFCGLILNYRTFLTLV